MHRLATTLVLCGGIGVLATACATKGFVREQVGTSEAQVRQALDRTGQQVQGLDTRVGGLDTRVGGLDTRVGEIDTRVGQVGIVAEEARTVAQEARKDAATVASAQREAQERLDQRFANRNRYATIDTRFVFFDFNKATLRDEGINELQDVARALQADPNAVLELQGFADSRGSDRYNYQLTRDRVDAVARHLVQRHGIDLRRIHAVGMGKAALPAGEKPTRDALARSRRVEIRLVAPQG